MITGRQLVEKMYSENEEMEERLYSTGNDDLDDLLERAFCDGYYYAQREFGEVKRKNKAAKKKFEEILGDEVTKNKTNKIDLRNGYVLSVGPTQQELNKEGGNIIRSNKILNQYYDSVNKRKIDFDPSFNPFDTNELRKTLQEAGIDVDTKVTSKDLARHHARDIQSYKDPSDLKDLYERNKEGIKAPIEEVIDPLTVPLKDRKLTPEMQEKLRRKQGVQDSIKKHEEEIKKLRENNKTKIALRDAKRWAKKNPKTTAAIGLGTAGLATAGVAAHKHNKNKKNNE